MKFESPVLHLTSRLVTRSEINRHYIQINAYNTESFLYTYCGLVCPTNNIAEITF